MPRTADHIAATHTAAARLRAAGKPIWAHHISLVDIWKNEAMTFEARRDAVVARLRASGWLKDRDPEDQDDEVMEIVWHLGDAPDADEFDGWWDDLYDHADADRVWIALF